jgi:hypothetical protein
MRCMVEDVDFVGLPLMMKGAGPIARDRAGRVPAPRLPS